jgi:uncharacterized protein (DUF433 family)
MNQAEISSKKTILGGRPAIAGTRVSVDDVAAYIANGRSISDIKKAYPTLSNDQIRAALEYVHGATSREIQKLKTTAA